MMKLRVGWGLRVRRYEERICLGRAGNIAKECWTEKKQYGRIDTERKGKDILIELDEERKWKKE